MSGLPTHEERLPHDIAVGRHFARAGTAVPYRVRIGDGYRPSAGDILHLQRVAGNRAVVSLLAAGKGSLDDLRQHALQRDAAQAPSEPASPVLDVVNAGGGMPVPAGIRSRMEAHLGADLRGVRVHTDAISTESVGARAYTKGGRSSVLKRLTTALQLQGEARNRSTLRPLQITVQCNGTKRKRADPPGSGYHLRSRDKLGKTKQGATRNVPDGFKKGTDLDGSLKAIIFSGWADLPEKVAVYRTPNGRTMLWWLSPLKQVDDFVYFGNREEDIADLNQYPGGEAGYTWHHTGYPLNNNAAGTMQLVPTKEHQRISHVGALYADRHGVCARVLVEGIGVGRELCGGQGPLSKGFASLWKEAFARRGADGRGLPDPRRPVRRDRPGGERRCRGAEGDRCASWRAGAVVQEIQGPS